MIPLIIAVVASVCILSQIIAMFLAGRRGRDSMNWGIAALLFPPLLLVLFLLPDLRARKNKTRRDQEADGEGMTGWLT